jgi:uncharacterized small protein (DUF1192 family)
MNYSEQLKSIESKATNLKAQTLAKKKTIEEEIEKRKKIEEECQSNFGISLAEVNSRIEFLKKEIERVNKELLKEVDDIETELEAIS